MAVDAALREPLVRRILAKVIDRLDVQPAEDRTLSIRVDLDDAMAPEIHAADSLADRAVAWAAVDGIVTEGWATIGYRLNRRHGSREERKPYLDFRWPMEIESRVREEINRPPKEKSYLSRWRKLVEKADVPLSESSRSTLATSALAITGRSPEEVLDRFLQIRQLANEPLLLREVSSRLFWGLSKVLDGRGDSVAALLGTNECPFPEQPIVLNVHVAAQFTSLLFVENHVAFERLKRRDDLSEHGLIYCGGFRGAAMRLRQPGGCSVYYSRTTSQGAIARFEDALFSLKNVPTFFWGDLDFSGMAILASLRSTFPSADAWRQGYEPMLQRLLNGDGHSPIEAGKQRQRTIAHTGCSYADETLIPALMKHDRFVDQE